MDVRFVSASGVDEHHPADLPDLLAGDDGFVWVDVPTLDDEAEEVLASTFGFHGLTLRACRERNHVPATHAYPEYAFVVLHAPDIGAAGHVHLLELDQFVGSNFLVTVHGPINPEVPLERALTETEGALRRIQEGRFRPTAFGGSANVSWTPPRLGRYRVTGSFEGTNDASPSDGGTATFAVVEPLAFRALVR